MSVHRGCHFVFPIYIHFQSTPLLDPGKSVQSVCIPFLQQAGTQVKYQTESRWDPANPTWDPRWEWWDPAFPIWDENFIPPGIPHQMRDFCIPPGILGGISKSHPGFYAVLIHPTRDFRWELCIPPEILVGTCISHLGYFIPPRSIYFNSRT